MKSQSRVQGEHIPYSSCPLRKRQAFSGDMPVPRSGASSPCDLGKKKELSAQMQGMLVQREHKQA